MNDNSFRSVRILLVEDSEADIILLKEVFETVKIKNELSVVRDGSEALEFLNKTDKYKNSETPDLIFLDLNIPRVSGHEVLTMLKSNQELSYIPVVILTTSNSIEDVRKAYSNHANCFITKPMNIEDFVNIVKSIKHFWFDIVRLPSK